MNFDKNVFLGVVIFFLIIITVVYLKKADLGIASPSPTPYSAEPSKYDDFAKCLASKGVKMYGAFWCSHCQNQKAAFGSSFQYIDYTECTVDGSAKSFSQTCQEAGIKGYPTWKFPNGIIKEGEVPFSDLANLSGCQLPQ